MKSTVFGADGQELGRNLVPIGGGFVVTEQELDKPLTSIWKSK